MECNEIYSRYDQEKKQMDGHTTDGKIERQMDRHTNNKRDTIIPCNKIVAEYSNQSFCR